MNIYISAYLYNVNENEIYRISNQENIQILFLALS